MIPEEIRKRKIEQLTRQQESQNQLAKAEHGIKQFLTGDALVRYGNIKAANPELAEQLIMVLAQLLQSGQLAKVDDATLKKILHQFTQKKEIRIIRK
jgi:DNA-binding TFAR19-related protein (PDSD5 family)